jgi:hypothetical protein
VELARATPIGLDSRVRPVRHVRSPSGAAGKADREPDGRAGGPGTSARRPARAKGFPDPIRPRHGAAVPRARNTAAAAHVMRSMVTMPVRFPIPARPSRTCAPRVRFTTPI